MTGGDDSPPVSAFKAGVLGRCPRCGEGALYQGFLTVRAQCAVCNLDLSKEDSGDGPAAFLIFIVGGAGLGLAVWLAFGLELPTWAVMLIITPFVIGLTVGLLRPFKALLIALQYKYKSGEN